jgi:hypothetical protein
MGRLPKMRHRYSVPQKMAPLERLELPTNRFEAGYSIQLSYRGEMSSAMHYADLRYPDRVRGLVWQPCSTASFHREAIKPVIAVLADSGDQPSVQG